MVPSNIAQYWADILQPLAPGDAYLTGSCGSNSTTVPVVAAYDLFCGNSLNETTGLLILDFFGLSGASGNSYFPAAGGGQPFTFYNPQFATLYVWKSMGTASYNAMQVDLKHKFSHGVEFDFNYTFSKSIDLASDAERVGTIGGNGGQIET